MSDHQIVTVNVYQTVGLVPSALQQTGAIVSLQSTLLPPGGTQLITQMADIRALVDGKNTFTVDTLTSDGSELMLTVLEDTTLANNDVVNMTLSGVVPDTFNGTYAFTYEGNKTFTATTTLAAASATTPGKAVMAQSPDDRELLRKFTTFFAQGSRQSVYVLELGALSGAMDELTLYLEDPPVRFWSVLVPDMFDGVSGFLNLARNYAANESMVYFFVDTVPVFQSGVDYVSVYKGIKSVVCSAVNENATFSPSAALMWNYIGADPSDINKVPPMSFRYLLGVTPFEGSGAEKTALYSNYVNYVATGAEGGISNTLVSGGFTSDGNDMTYWYSVDWVQINVHMALANTVINGSNNPINPLYYNQDGIDRLQISAQAQFDRGVSYGLVNGNPVVGAVPLGEYLRNNPSDYQTGRYAGLSAEYTPMRGFTKIIFNINVTMNLS